MRLNPQTHLTYCTNIHASEDWPGMWESLKAYALPLSKDLAKGKSFGIGLWLSNRASQELLASEQLPEFKQWLNSNGLYVFTCNAFPYGGFHRQVVKDKVHHPDWQSRDRLLYTKRIIDILSELLPEGVEGGLSTSPLTYKHWLKTAAEKERAFQVATQHILQVVEHLHDIHWRKGQVIHLDIEPEPDGLIENTKEVLDYYQNYLIPAGHAYFAGKIPSQRIEEVLLRHITICYDVCHFAVAYEEPSQAIPKMLAQGIRIGKVQISAALKAGLAENPLDRSDILAAFNQFNENTYLHQVIARRRDGCLVQFPDLTPALAVIENPDFAEYRTHYHVPLFIDRYGLLESTQEDIVKALSFFAEQPFTNHLEIETYTWEVLPKELQLDLKSSIEREVNWVLNQLKH